MVDSDDDNKPVSMPSLDQLRRLQEDRRRGCICREFIGGALKIESGCPVHRLCGICMKTYELCDCAATGRR